MDTIKIDRKNAEIIAHRGICGLETENTAASFIAAANRNYYAIETDVQVTKDGEFVLLHDYTTGRLADVDLSIKDTDYSVLSQVCLKEYLYGTDNVFSKTRNDLRIPTLSEYIDICKKYEKKCMVELKGTFDPRDVERLLKLIEDKGYMSEVIFTAWDTEALKQIRKALPENEIVWNVKDLDEEIIKTMKDYSFEISLRADKVNKDIIDLIHLNGRKISVWYAYTKEEAEKMIDMGVDYLVSNILE